jgi:hypothetical protein
MKLWVMSDLHLECAALDLPDPGAFDVAVLAGDIAGPGTAVPGWVRSTPVLRRAKAVVWVCGNHEYYDALLPQRAQAMRAAAKAVDVPPLHLLDGDFAVVDGVRFVGCTLWTDFALRIDTPQGARADPERAIGVARSRMADYRAIAWPDGDDPLRRRRLRPEDTMRVHAEQRRWLQLELQRPFDGPTVVVTHHAPHRGSLAPRYAADWISAAYVSELPDAVFDTPVLWVHGHTHCSRDHVVGRCRVVCNPRGYALAGRALPENAAFDPALVIDIAAHGR